VAKQTTLNPILASLWGAAQVAVQNKTSQGEFIRTIKTAAQAQGIDLSHVNAAQYSKLRSAAVGVRNGIEAYTKASNDSAITNDMLPDTFFSRPLNEQNLVNRANVSIAMTYIENGTEKTNFYNVELRNFIYTNKGALEEAIRVEAQILASNYGFSYSSHITTQIEAV